MDKRPVYIYGLTEPDGSRVRYVGRSIDPRMRYRKHLLSTDKNKSYCANWIRSHQRKGLKPGIILIECCDPNTWQQRERYWISHFPDLTSSESGGDRDYTYSLETRKKLSKAQTGRKPSEETRRKIGDAHRGRKHSEESKRKRSEKLKGWQRFELSGEAHPKSKLTAAQVIEIRREYATGKWTQRALGEKFDTPRNTIRNIVTHGTWKYVEGEKTLMGAARGERAASSKLTEADVIEIRRLYATGNYSQRKLGKHFNITQPAIGKIIRRKRWKHI